MGQPRIAPYGSWESPISVELAVAGAVRLREVRIDGEDVYWVEGRPAEGGRQVVVRYAPDGDAADVTPPGFNARTMVHEYGGGSYTVAGGEVFFSNLPDGRVYHQPDGGAPRPLTESRPVRYADFVVDTGRRRLICVQEDHTAADQAAQGAGGNDAPTHAAEPRNTLVAIPIDAAGEPLELVSGADFYASPALSPDGRRLAWLSWNHPNMPWDGTELWVGELAADGTVASSRRVAGGPSESVVQPEWSPQGVLHLVSDRSGWWNLYRWAEDDGVVQPLAPAEAEFAGPQWVFGLSTYAFEADSTIVCSARSAGRDRLYRVDAASGTLRELDTGHTEYTHVRGGARRVVFIAGSPLERPSVLSLDEGADVPRVLRAPGELGVDPGHISQARSIEFRTPDGQTAYGLFYAPTNRDFVGAEDERPPLVVHSHGGPTGNASSALDLEIQVFTSRGIAVVDVDYRGSTGYGRAYRAQLDGRWGIVDVDDCTEAARSLVASGAADASRLAISGGSAGGYTTLSAVTFRDVFSAGASHYGVGDLEALTRETHKFESRYLDRLVAPYPERRDVYLERSPIHHTERIRCPLILLQGLEDKVVPAAQAELMVEALDRRGLPYAYIAFEGEGHGFRRAENISRALEAELSFYAQVFGFALADAVEPVAIANLPARMPSPTR